MSCIFKIQPIAQRQRDILLKIIRGITNLGQERVFFGGSMTNLGQDWVCGGRRMTKVGQDWVCDDERMTSFGQDW